MTKLNNIPRKIGLITATSIVIANMIGAGIFTTSGLIASNLPSPTWVIMCWIFGGIFSILGALCYTELGTRMPEEGGEYVYLSRLFHPILGFLTGWISFFVGFSAPIAASAIGFSEYIFSGINPEVLSNSFIGVIGMKKILGIFIVAIFTFLHYTGIKWGARIQNILTFIKVLIVVGLTLLGFYFSRGEQSFSTILPLENEGGLAIGTAMMFIMFAYAGYNGSTYIAGEIKNPKRNLLLSMVVGTGIVMLIYVAINLFIFSTIPFEEARGSIAIVEKAANYAFGKDVGNIISILSGIALLSSLSAFIMTGPRIYYAMAKDSLFFEFAGKLHPKFKVPSLSILIQGCIAVIFVVFSSFEQILIYVEYLLLIFPIIAVSGIFIARKKKIGEDIAVKTPLYPWIPILFLLSSLFLIVIAYINRPWESSIAFLTILVGIPLYKLIKK